MLAPPQHRGEIEAETIHVHRFKPVAQRVHDQPYDGRAIKIDAVAAAGIVHVVTPRSVSRPGQSVVRDIVQPSKADCGTHLIALAGMIVNRKVGSCLSGAVGRPTVVLALYRVGPAEIWNER
jgi:hypothetical protein